MKTKTFFVVGLFALFTVLFTGCRSGGPLFNKTSHTDVTETARATASNTQTIERVVEGEKAPPITGQHSGNEQRRERDAGADEPWI
jgi:predicted component of type VI protein secretion system